MVTYFLCFDLSEPLEGQIDQVGYWLDFLNSALPLPHNASSTENEKWTIMIVGLRADLVKFPPPLQPHHLQSWKKRWPRLPIFHQMFMVSSTTSIDSVRELLELVSNECTRIFSTHKVRIPTLYRRILNVIEKQPDTESLVHKSVLQQHFQGMDDIAFQIVLHYLHSVGRIVFMKNGLVLTNPTLAPKIAAKFVSPEEVRINLLRKRSISVQVLKKEEIGCLLDISKGANEK